MLALNIPQSEIKCFMNMLLKEEVFDKFEVRSAVINSFIQFNIDGLLEIKEETESSVKNYISWKKLRPYIFNIIKGSPRPRIMKLVFSLPRDNMQKLADGASAMFLNILFESGEVLITTGASQKVFSLDKSVEAIWDEYIKKFCKKNNIPVSYI